MIDLSTIPARLELATKYATLYGLDPALVAALVDRESGWNVWATRYEPMFFVRYIQPLLNRGVVTSLTEAYARATSYGLAQVMGQTARELGFKGKFLTELCDPEVGLSYGCKKLAQCFERHPNDRNAALLAYNGGGEPNYPHLVLDNLAQYLS